VCFITEDRGGARRIMIAERNRIPRLTFECFVPFSQCSLSCRPISSGLDDWILVQEIEFPSLVRYVLERILGIKVIHFPEKDDIVSQHGAPHLLIQLVEPRLMGHVLAR